MHRWMRRAMAMPVLWAVIASIGLLAVPAANAAGHSAARGQAARFASEATAYQNKILERALSHVPGGTRISPSEARWPDGNIVGVPASPKQSGLTDCLNSAGGLAVFCGFTGTSYSGSWDAALAASGSGYWAPWGELTGTGMHSWLTAPSTAPGASNSRTQETSCALTRTAGPEMETTTTTPTTAARTSMITGTGCRLTRPTVPERPAGR
jgi:hypothetical protein